MPSVDQFKKSLREMEDDELDDILDTTRNERVKSKSAQKKKKSSSSSSSSSSSDTPSELPDDMDDLTPEEAQQILNNLK